MAIRSNEQVVFKDYPLMFWFFAVMMLVVSALIDKATWQLRLVELAGVVVIALSPILIVVVDHTGGTLNLHYRSLLRASTKTYPLSEISFVNVAEIRDENRMYRVELILWSGEVVPLRSGYSTGKARKERRAQQLRSVLGIGGEMPVTRIMSRRLESSPSSGRGGPPKAG